MDSYDSLNISIVALCLCGGSCNRLLYYINARKQDFTRCFYIPDLKEAGFVLEKLYGFLIFFL